MFNLELDAILIQEKEKISSLHIVCSADSVIRVPTPRLVHTQHWSKAGSVELLEVASVSLP